MLHRARWFLAAMGVLGGWLGPFVHAEEPAAAIPALIKFDRDIRPILAENCFACHGPDAHKRKAKLRLDTREGAFATHEDHAAIVPGDLAKSELIRRITATDPDDHMPPAETGKKLTERQIALFKKWIEQKAEYPAHWAFVPPVRPEIPAVSNPKWVRNPVDAFILARLDKEGLKPSPEADKTTLIRRLTLDLTGLPPTPAEIDAFVNDPSPDAYEKVVDRLLANPHYGERMTLEWLDAARFADTHGYHIDSGRDMTHWRDEVIASYNNNQPCDQFIVEQLAGDLIPKATTQEKIASGFNRNHMINFEGGAIAEEYHTAYLIDRVNTTSTVFLGLTLGCTQCHDHKFDPFTQKDYYSMYAFFNNVPENGLDGAKGNAAPILRAASPEQQKKLDEYSAQIAAITNRLTNADPELDAGQVEWEKTVSQAPVAWIPAEPSHLESAGKATFVKLDDRSIKVTGNNAAKDSYSITLPTTRPVTGLLIESLPDDSLNGKGPGRGDNGNFVLTGLKVSSGGKPLKIKDVSADFSQDTFPVFNLLSPSPNKGYAIFPEVGKAHMLTVALESPVEPGEVTLTLEFNSIFPQHTMGHLRISVTGSKNPISAANVPANIAQVLLRSPEKRSAGQKSEIRRYFRNSVSSQSKALQGHLATLKREQTDFDRTIPSTMVMQEMATPRDTFILMRGQYDKKGEKVTANTPAALPPMAGDLPKDRLGLAKWLINPQHPLTSRVFVNRYWQMYFGTGIVKTAEDFGSQGEYPSHPQLLDFLATEFMSSGWNVKAMQRLIVTSSTYRQSSFVSKELYEKDPENRLLARGPRMRLPAEFIRDLALSTSGLLSPEIGGKSVNPYQPPGLWEELMSRLDGANWTAQVYKQDHGADLYKRTMYTFWKRTSPPPTLSTFDAPDREVCTVRRSRTNTPLQALVLLNDPTYVEASRKLAERMMREGGKTGEERIEFAYRLVLGRLPKPAEIQVLKNLHETQLAAYRKDPAQSDKLLNVGESKADLTLDRPDLAAWSMVASTILNLDEAITKG
jgi:mono/diheme cytochrome c family protein